MDHWEECEGCWRSEVLEGTEILVRQGGEWNVP